MPPPLALSALGNRHNDYEHSNSGTRFTASEETMKEIQVFDLVIFGGSGDLAMRKLLPALYYRHRDSDDCTQSRIIAVARRTMDRETYLNTVQENCRKFVPKGDFDEEAWKSFVSYIDYCSIDATRAEDFERLGTMLRGGPVRTRVFFLATAPDLYIKICTNLGAAGLVTAESRVVLEKPLGRDLASAQNINAHVGRIFEERQIFRIDHYLGKEAVQNLLALRFGNSLFEPLWNRGSIRDVQITIAEQVGVEGRGEFYEHIGALRDMVQSHLLQLLCIVAMEPPSSIDPDAVRDEKVKVLRALKPLTGRDVANNTVRGQYRAGAIDGRAVPGYLDEPGIAGDSNNETFVAIRAGVDNWRWAGVPFYLRTGKRMPDRLAQIVVNFREVPHAILPVTGHAEQPSNRLVIQLQPDDGLKLFMMAKTPGEEMCVSPVHLNLNFAETFKTREWDAYERLLMDVIRGNLTLFMRHDELDAAWRWIDPILDAWQAASDPPKPYASGTWGPAAAIVLIARDGHSWHEEV
jgi:glucose-6-phosphate 1-dehydrogenase